MAKILIADDEAPMRDMIGFACKMDEHEVMQAYDTPSAVSAYRSFGPDLLILDLYMPGGGGVAVLKQVQFDTGAKLCPVIIVSGYVADMSADTLDNLTVFRIIEKPFSVESLRSAIREALDPGMGTKA